MIGHIIVGTTTFGKGLVQSVHPLQDGSGLAVTVARYHTPNGRDIHKTGIEPDIIVELTQEQIESLEREDIGTSADPQYAKAISVLKGRNRERPTLRAIISAYPDSNSPKISIVFHLPHHLFL